MKYQLIRFSFLLLLCLNISCEKAGKIHLISAHTWVVTEVPSLYAFVKVGDELTFHDNRLFFKISDGVETDGRWDLLNPGGGFGGTSSSNLESLFVSTSFHAYDFSISKLSNTELEIKDFFNPGNVTVRLEAKE